jgi:hypothetical protein
VGPQLCGSKKFFVFVSERCIRGSPPADIARLSDYNPPGKSSLPHFNQKPGLQI